MNSAAVERKPLLKPPWGWELVRRFAMYTFVRKGTSSDPSWWIFRRRLKEKNGSGRKHCA